MLAVTSTRMQHSTSLKLGACVSFCSAEVYLGFLHMSTGFYWCLITRLGFGWFLLLFPETSSDLSSASDKNTIAIKL